jgi:hypothetical protein
MILQNSPMWARVPLFHVKTPHAYPTWAALTWRVGVDTSWRWIYSSGQNASPRGLSPATPLGVPIDGMSPCRGDAFFLCGQTHKRPSWELRRGGTDC